MVSIYFVFNTAYTISFYPTIEYLLSFSFSKLCNVIYSY